MSKYHELDLGKARTTSIRGRKSRVHLERFASPADPQQSFSLFYNSLPRLLAVQDLDALVESVAKAGKEGKPVLHLLGAHVVKTGLSPVIIDLMEYGCVQGIAMNGAGAIHDMEIAYFGKTSEDVASGLSDGSFGMSRETSELLNGTAREAHKNKMGFGEALGVRLAREKPPGLAQSILGQAFVRDIPATVHVALGTDIVHQHPDACGEAIGDATLRDFRIFAELVSRLNGGGVALLFGSAVVLPEVFLKALTVARNIKGKVTGFTTASFDMIRHYRPDANVVRRPIQGGGQGYSFIGHHEIMIPLFAAAVKNRIGRHS